MSESPDGRMGPDQGAPLTVLIIDDSPEDADVLAGHLDRMDRAVHCHHAELGEQGARMITDLRPDCLLLDFHLPDMTGLEFMELYRPQMPVLVVTGSAEHRVAAQVIRAGASRLLFKGDLSAQELHGHLLDGMQEHALRQQLHLERERMQAVLDSTGNGMLFIRPHLEGWTLEFQNPSASQLLRLDYGPLADTFTPLTHLLRQTQRHGVTLTVNAEHHGRSLTLECTPGADGFTVTVRDSSAEQRRHRLDQARHEVLQRFAEARSPTDVIQGLQDLIAATLPGYAGRLLTGAPLNDWPHLATLGVPTNSSAPLSGRAAQATFLPTLDGGCWALPITATDEDHLLGVFLITGSPADTHVPATLRDVVNLTTLLLMQSRDRERLQFQAWRDPLTGLPNRSVFMEQLQRELHSLPRNRTSLAVGILDLDGFKGVNDTLGHACGDALLVEVARRLRLAFRASDLVARVGGDEFTMLLTDWTNHETLEHDLKRRLEQVLADPFTITGVNVTVKASLGVAVAPQQAHSADNLLQMADRAMYHAKRTGGGLHLSTEVNLPRVH